MSSERAPFKVAGFFAGIGGIEAGLHRAGHRTVLLCEIDAGADAVLAERFPEVPRVRDVADIDDLPRDTDLVTAGFPCQDLSQAGMTKGIAGKKSGVVSHLFRILERNDVPWVLVENVPFMLQLGHGAAIRYVVERLEQLGYAWAYRIINSRAFGLPQRRERVYLVASRVADPADHLFARDVSAPPIPSHHDRACGFYWTEGLRGLGWAVDSVPTLKGGSTIGIPSPPAIWLPSGSFVTPDIRDAERLQGFDAEWTLPAEEVVRQGYRWKLVGNAVTVNVSYWLGKILSKDPAPHGRLAASFNQASSWPSAAFGNPSGERYAVRVSSWPTVRKAPPLEEFLRYPTKPMSFKALNGFSTRLSQSRLKRPREFDRDLSAALRRAQSRPTAAAASR